MELGLIIFITVIVVIFLSIGTYYLLRYLKGSIKINMTKTSFSTGEEVVGSFNLKTKKIVEGNGLYVSLEAERQERSRNIGTRRSSSSSSWVNVYKSEQVIENEKKYPQGYSNNYNFNIKVPSKNEMGIGTVNNQMIQNVLNVASAFTGVGRMRWYIIVRLDTQGVDLSSKKRINVNIVDTNQNTISN